MIGHFMHSLLKNVDHFLLIDAIMINYPKLKSVERAFDRLPRFLVNLLELQNKFSQN